MAFKTVNYSFMSIFLTFWEGSGCEIIKKAQCATPIEMYYSEGDNLCLTVEQAQESSTACHMTRMSVEFKN